jgi:nucleoside-diphosphate-sugar epimerase
MNSFVVYHTSSTGPGYFLTGDEAEGFGGTYRLSEASKFKSKRAAEKVARSYGAAGSANNVLRQTGESF